MGQYDSQGDGSRFIEGINMIGHQIDNLGYKLYGLTDSEIRIVEEATRA